MVAAWRDHLKTYESFIWLLKASAGFCVVALVGLYLCFGR
ncbi:MAG: aa3-type cytochrome c oxidase subunit IV [Methylocystaceae bacterium]|nr:aa3-type cytochrome c oxidase subunit IV [Methylocystaceae bacterium]